MRKKITIITGFFLVIFVISFAGKCAYSALPTGTGVLRKLRIFVTDTPYQGDLGGITGADSKCAIDTNNPLDGTTFRAMVMGGGRDRNNNWVLQPDTTYYRLDKTTIIGNTGSGKMFILPLANIVTVIGGGIVWTGIDASWNESANTCNGWTNNGALSGTRGMSSMTDIAFIVNSDNMCNINNKLYCVEQP